MEDSVFIAVYLKSSPTEADAARGSPFNRRAQESTCIDLSLIEPSLSFVNDAAMELQALTSNDAVGLVADAFMSKDFSPQWSFSRQDVYGLLV